jgi:hypothetical protein
VLSRRLPEEEPVKLVAIRWNSKGYRQEDVHLLRDPTRPSLDLRPRLTLTLLDAANAEVESGGDTLTADMQAMLWAAP